jgi:hypothetical protein
MSLHSCSYKFFYNKLVNWNTTTHTYIYSFSIYSDWVLDDDWVWKLTVCRN